MRTLSSTEHMRVEVDDARRLVRATRTDKAYATIDEAVRSFRDAARAADAVDRKKYVFLFDVRLAPGRNDPDFEIALGPPRREIFATWPRRAVLVRTTIGKLQISRIAREQAREEVDIFLDEAAALAHLLR